MRKKNKQNISLYYGIFVYHCARQMFARNTDVLMGLMYIDDLREISGKTKVNYVPRDKNHNGHAGHVRRYMCVVIVYHI